VLGKDWRVTSDLPPTRSYCEHAEEIAELRGRLAEQADTLAELRRAVAALTAQVTRMAATELPAAPASQPAPATAARASQVAAAEHGGLPYADQASSPQAKIILYRELFGGRQDVYARRYENRVTGKKGWWPVHAGNRHTPRDEREYLPLTDEVIEGHLAGRTTIGLYPLLTDDTCRLLACDFDKAAWRLDAGAYIEAADNAGVPTALEISRSGRGAHVWTFFTAPVAAADARALGAALLREAIAIRGEFDLDSYDRFFPSQDYLPDRGFGNLIALPLQGECRRDRNSTVFVDPTTFTPHPDQFAFLSAVHRLTPARVRQIGEELRPVAVGPEIRLYRSSVRADPPPPATIEARLGGMLAIRRAGLPPGLYGTLKHLGMLHNPQFHKNENLRLSNHATPRFIRCYDEDLEHLYLPRGVTDQAAAIVESAGSQLQITDNRTDPPPIDLTFTGQLRAEQQHAVQKLSAHDLGVLEAPPGAGKTVMACALIARHSVPTLILVDRKPLLDQWRDRLRTHLGVEPGQIGGGKNHPANTVDVAMLQTVTRSEQPGELLDGYGLVVVDECHHVPAPTVERAIRNLAAKRWLGLTATPKRADGLKEIMIMQCGPIRHRIHDTATHLTRTLHVHPTSLQMHVPTDGLTRSEVLAVVHAALVEDDTRTDQICQDVKRAVQRRRNCLVLSGRTEHVQSLAAGLRQHDLDPLVLYGSLKSKERQLVHDRLADDGHLLLVATDRYIGEGFDCPRLDTLFLTFPISGRERMIQYIGRILRDHPGKDAVEVHDYLDTDAPMLAAMYRRRQPAYRQLGFSPSRPTIKPTTSSHQQATIEEDEEEEEEENKRTPTGNGISVTERPGVQHPPSTGEPLP
jgi:superfamily II DNA or RNA helicase